MLVLLLLTACGSGSTPNKNECADRAFADVDRDGHGDPGTEMSVCDAPADYVPTADDCDDSSELVHPDADELCNEIDDDCDGEIDDGATDVSTWYADADGDGYGDEETFDLGCDAPSGFVLLAGDCDVDDPAVNPGADEKCNDVDDDCDALVDAEDPTLVDGSVWYADADGDGFGDIGSRIVACEQPASTVEDATDCDDGDGAVSPSAIEVCDLIDNDCDELVDDEDDGVDAHVTFYVDTDGDGYGDPASTTLACVLPVGFADNDEDCDDTSAATGPALSYWTDEDGDGWGTGSVHATCTPAVDDVLSNGDCRPFDATIHPDAPEVCNEHDDNCDSLVDDEDPLVVADVWYVDDDGDGFGDPKVALAACEPPDGYVSTSGDCDDTDATRYDGAPEYCDGVDNDCDGTVDVDVDYVDWFADVDGDGFGDASVSVNDCIAPSGYVAVALDCDDSDAEVSPSGVEVCDGGRDEDCNGFASDCTVAPEDSDAILWQSLRVTGWSFPGAFGSYTVTADVDADGTAELVVGDSDLGYSDSFLDYLGSAFIVPGPLSGEASIEDAAAIELSGAESYEYFGSSVGAGDVNGDSADDVASGARGLSSTFLFYGPLTTDRDSSAADVTLSTSLWLETGWDVDIGPDLDFDGTLDIVLGAPVDASGFGRIYVASGTSSGSVDLTTDSTYVLQGVPDVGIGFSNMDAGDVDGDGLDDLAIGSGGSDTGRVLIVPGGLAAGTYDIDDASVAVLEGRTGEWIGFSQTAVDYDEDGFSDLIVTAFEVPAVYGVLGPLSGAVDTSTASVSWSASEPDALTGVWALAAGDVDGDKSPDVLMGAQYAYDFDGVAYLQFGLASGVVDVGSLTRFSFGDRECGGGTITLVPDWTGDDGAEVAIAVGSREDDATSAYGAIAIYNSEQLY